MTQKGTMTYPYGEDQDPYRQQYGQDPYQQQPQYGHNPYAQQPFGYPMGYPQPVGPKNNGLAIASMCVSLAGIFTCYGAILIGAVGAILGHVAMRELNRRPEAYVSSNRSMALTGIIAGWITSGLWILLIVFVILAGTGVLGPDLSDWFNS